MIKYTCNEESYTKRRTNRKKEEVISMAVFTKYSLRLVKEESKRYECSNVCESPEDAVNVVNRVHELKDQPEEVLILICLNVKNKVIGTFEVSRGSLSRAVVHPREIFKRALAVNASAIIIAHNHPSGEVSPSQADIDLTKKIDKGGEILGIKLLDHVIVGERDDYDCWTPSYISLKAEGYL